MVALALDVDFTPSGGEFRRLPSEAAANPFGGSLLSYNAAGFAHELVAGEPFAGITRVAIETAKAALSNGARFIEVIAGAFTITATIAGIVQDDASRRRRVYAQDDGTLGFTATGNTLIGCVVGVDGTKAIVACRTADLADGTGCQGNATLADASVTLLVSQLDKILVMTATAARTLTLPPAAQCVGRTYTVVTLGAFAITFDGDAAELVNGAATFAGGATAGSVNRIYSTGLAWVSF